MTVLTSCHCEFISNPRQQKVNDMSIKLILKNGKSNKLTLTDFNNFLSTNGYKITGDHADFWAKSGKVWKGDEEVATWKSIN